MRLLVDGLFLRPGRVGGVEYMLYSLLTSLASARSEGDDIRVLLPEGAGIADRSFSASVERVAVPPGNRFLAVERHLPRDYDVALFPNYYTPLATLRRRGRASVTVVHDLQFRAFPRNFTPAKRAFQQVALRMTSHRATRVVAISGFTASEMAAFQPAVRGRLDVVPNPVDWSRFEREAAPEGAGPLESGPFFLLAATQYRHKNIGTAVEAFRRVHARHPSARLVLVGQIPEILGETKVGSSLPDVPGVLQMGFVPDAVLAWLYRRAAAVLLPSLYEGCGLPCAEAIGLGTPVVHSGRGALPEVARGHGFEVADPLASDDWADAMVRALDGRIARPTSLVSAEVRAVHDPAEVGEHYWKVLRTAAAAVG